jgi:hypothetical protein
MLATFPAYTIPVGLVTVKMFGEKCKLQST